MSVQTEVIYRLKIYLILGVIMVPLITIFLKIVVLTNVSFGVILIFLLLFIGEYFLLSTMLSYGFGKYAAIANILYLILTLFVTIISALNPSIS